MKTGIFGGSFNPVHNGHVRLMQSMVDGLALDRLIMLPAGRAPHKSCAQYAPAADRLNMCRLATQTVPRAEVSSWELEKSGSCYTIDTLRHFSALYPEDEFFLTVGGDMLKSFTQWRDWRELLKLATLAAVCRESGEEQELEETAGFLRQYGRIILLKSVSYTISSTEIRQLVGNGKDFSCYLPKKVVEYIIAEKLYGYCSDGYV